VEYRRWRTPQQSSSSAHVITYRLLQTPDYIRALIGNGPQKDDPVQVKRLVEARILRGDVLTAEDSGKTFEFLVHESALELAVGGDEVTSGQLRKLIEVALPLEAINVLVVDAIGGQPLWFLDLFDEEVADLEPGDDECFYRAMGLIRSRAQQRELSLVIRDWSHADWVGFPFVSSPPLHFSWDCVRSTERCEADAVPAVFGGVDSLCLAAQAVAVAEEAPEPFAAIRCATVRHPVDQYLSTHKLDALQRAWDEEAPRMGD
jgi:hypothetical protein